MKELKTPLTIRGDSLYCPLSFTLDTYGNCFHYCHHCYIRRLNHVWGEELKPLFNTEGLKRKLMNGQKNKNPKSFLAHAIKNKNTIRFGNKADPYQRAELKYKVSREALKILNELDWSTVVQTKNTEILKRDEDILLDMKDITVMPVISPGMDKDWEILEKKSTTPPRDRLFFLYTINKKGVKIGVNGEPFIPGFHTLKDFEDALKLLKHYKIPSYNTYNLHMNDWVAKNLCSIGLDIEKIWKMNQDEEWKKILPKLIDLSKKYNIILGCPDFINSGKYRERANTCCGINVSRPTTFNVITWKRELLEGKKSERVFRRSWDGVGDFDFGKKIFTEESNDKFYTLKESLL